MARPLKVFMRGKSVTLLQEVLRRMGYAINDQRALFGTDTRDAVKSFQKQQGLKPTGLVDDELMKLMTHGQSPVVIEEESAEEIAPAVATAVNQLQLDALIRLLLRKGVIEVGELEAEMKRAIPKGL